MESIMDILTHFFGSIELPAPEGEPEVFVISSGGTGIPVYRRLQKEHIPFAAGILYEMIWITGWPDYLRQK